jgi:hypothetical protein
MRSFIALAALALTACSGTALSEAPNTETYSPETEKEVHFSDVLAQYQALNTRLDYVAAPLLLANTALCPRTERSLGLTVHMAADYPVNLQPVARELLSVTDRLSIRTVRAGSPADIAGLKPGDEVLRVNDSAMPVGETAQRFYAAISQDAYRQDQVDLTVKRLGQTLEVSARPETICGYPATVYFSEEINGHTDGEQVLITSELMRNVPDNVNLALIIAHEMGHAIAGHVELRKSKALELKADRMALVLMQRAGYDINAAISYWQKANHPHAGFQRSSKTHPSISERYENFKAEQARIEKLNTAGQPLTFD